MKQNKGNMKYKIKDLQDGQIYTVSELSDLLNIDMQGKVVVERPFNYYKCVGKVGIFDDGATSAKTIDILEEYNPSSTAPFRTQQGVYYKSFRLLNEEEIIKYCRG